MSEKNYDVAALGELLIDFTQHGKSEQGNLLFEANPGGAPANVLSMLRKLGKNCAFLGKVGADGFGKPIDKVCHRPALYAERAGAPIDAVVTPECAARVILAEGFGDRVYINQVESADGYAAAEELTKRLTCPVVAGSLHKGVYTCLR